eukprot:m.361170 g.361170  ORF g.361170 m.361170 type:complete len:405 (+) comp19396_c0_seq1:266-1480(+)
MEVFAMQLKTFAEQQAWASIKGQMTQLKDELQGNPQLIPTLCQLLTPATDALALAIALKYQIESSRKTDAEWISNCAALFNFGDAQQLQAADSLPVVAEFYASVFQSKDTICALGPLKSLAEKLQKSPNEMNFAHHWLSRLAVLAKCYSFGAEAMPVPFSKIAPAGLDTLSCLETVYSVGVLHMGMKNFKTASLFLRMATYPPGHAVSQVSVAAMKKYILIELIQNGKVPHHKSHGNTQSILQQAVKSYKVLETTNATELAREIEANQAQYAEDNNLGLILQWVEASAKHRIKKLTKTYMKLSLADIAVQAQLENVEQAEQLVEQMVLDGQLLAKIDQASGVVTFSNAKQTHVSQAELEARFKRVAELYEQTLAKERELKLTEQYLKAERMAAPAHFEDEFFES